MASENVEVIRRNFEAFDRGDVDTVFVRVSPDFVIGDRAVPEGSPAVKGPAALAATIDDIREAFGDVRWDPLEFVDLGERVLVRVRIEGTADHTELPIGEDIAHLYTLRDGLMVRLDIYRTWAEAKAATGLEH